MPRKNMKSIKGSIKQYEKLKSLGFSKKSAARITNAAAKKGKKKGKR